MKRILTALVLSALLAALGACWLDENRGDVNPSPSTGIVTTVPTSVPAA